MKIRELAALLQKEDQDSEAVRGDNSGGYEDIFEVKSEEVTKAYGPEKDKKVKVVVIE